MRRVALSHQGIRMRPLSNYAARDVEALLHPTTNLATHRESGPLVLERGEGVYVFDSAGKRYIEGLAGLWCTGLGYGNAELVETAREQMSRLSFSHLFGGRSHEPAIALAEKLKAMAPCPTSKVFFTNSGSEANDTQVKIAWYANNALGRPKKKKIISRKRAYHGTTVAAASLSGIPVFHADFDLPMARVLHTDCPHYWKESEPGESEEEYSSRLVRNLEEMIEREGPETIAAFIAEPVMGAGGVLLPPKTYFQKVQAAARAARHRLHRRRGDLRFRPHRQLVGVADLRPGAHHRHHGQGHHLGLRTHGRAHRVGAGLPGAARRERQAGRVRPRLYLFGPPARLRHRRQDAGDLRAHQESSSTCAAWRRSSRFASRRSPSIRWWARRAPSVCWAGWSWSRTSAARQGFEPKLGVGAKAARFAEEEGLLCRAVGGDNIGLCPPLVIEAAEINAIFDMLARALDKTEAWARKEGHL